VQQRWLVCLVPCGVLACGSSDSGSSAGGGGAAGMDGSTGAAGEADSAIIGLPNDDAAGPGPHDATADVSTSTFTCTKPDAGVEPLTGSTPCASRPITPCPAALPGQFPLAKQLESVIDQCGGIPDESTIEVWAGGGCVTDWKADISGPFDASADRRDCMRGVLSAARYDCAAAPACASVQRSTLR